MFGLTRREQFWKAEQQVAEALAPVLVAAVHANAQIRVAEASIDANELTRLRAEVAELRAMLTRYRTEVPLGHQPHMLAHKVDELLQEKQNG